MYPKNKYRADLPPCIFLFNFDYMIIETFFADSFSFKTILGRCQYIIVWHKSSTFKTSVEKSSKEEYLMLFEYYHDIFHICLHPLYNAYVLGRIHMHP